MEFHPFIACLSDTHFYDDAPNSFCPPGYVVAARQNRSKHGSGVATYFNTRAHIV